MAFLAKAAEERAINDCFSEVEPEIVKSQGIVDYDFQAPTPGIGREVDGKVRAPLASRRDRTWWLTATASSRS
eukprot:scaffold1724_cov246-Pinguiococcus_pyrenoidosus.AAC.18